MNTHKTLKLCALLAVPAAVVIVAVMIVALAVLAGAWSAPGRAAFAQGGATPTPGSGGFGPIIGPDYTPEPLHTPLPQTVSERACSALVTAETGAALYGAPDASAAQMGAASAREQLTVVSLATDAAGNTWAQTDRGWLPLTLQGVQQASLEDLRACDILQGTLPDTTLAGLHLLNGTSSEEVLRLVQRLRDAGTPMGTVKGLNGAEQLLSDIKAISPETVTVFRSLLTTQGLRDCPAEPGEYGDDPEGSARAWLESLEPYWSAVDADYYELFNECPVDLGWINRFAIEAMRLANEQERCLLLFSFPGGNPEMAQFNDVLPAYQYAAENKCQPGRHHGIALHAYSLEDGLLVSQADKWIGFRHRLFEEELRQRLPEAVDLPVYITELGEGGGMAIPSCETLVRDVMQYTYQLEEDPYVRGFHIWSVGSGTLWVDITPCLDALGDALIAYYQG